MLQQKCRVGWKQTCDAGNSILQPPGFDFSKALTEAEEAVQRHLRLVVIIGLQQTANVTSKPLSMPSRHAPLSGKQGICTYQKSNEWNKDGEKEGQPTIPRAST